MAKIEIKSAKGLLKVLLEQRGLRVETLEETTPREAVARVQFPGLGVRTVTAEVADEDAGLWSRDADPRHPCRFCFPGGMPVPARKADSVTASLVYVSFSPDGRNAIMLLGEDLLKHGHLRPAGAAEEAVYVVPLSCCIVLHKGPHGN